MDVSGLIGILIYLIVIGLVFYLLYWLLGQIPLPEPVKTVALVILALVLVILLLNIVFGFAPAATPNFHWHH
jgi:uncharacterized membrane-anchored protein